MSCWHLNKFFSAERTEEERPYFSGKAKKMSPTTVSGRNKIERPGGRKERRIKVRYEKWDGCRLSKIQYGDYYRNIIPSWAREMKDNLAKQYEPNTLAHTIAPIHVSQRADGSIFNLTGQHRIYCAIELSLILQVIVHEGLTYSEEISFYNDQQLSRAESPSHFFDNYAKIDNTVATVRDFFNRVVPGWNREDMNVPIKRLGWTSSIDVIRGIVRCQNRKNIEKTCKSFLPEWQEYLVDVLEIVKGIFPWRESYGLSDISVKKNQIDPVWRNQYALLGVILTITQFHKKFGNCDKTNDMIYELFLTEDIIEYATEKANNIERGMQRLAYFSGFCIDKWNKKHHAAKKLPFPLGYKFRDWIGVSNKVNELPYDKTYHICQEL